MSAILNVKQTWTDGKRLHVVGTLTLAGSYVTGGIPLSFLATNPLLGTQAGIPTTQPIVHSDVTGKGGGYGSNIGTLYEYRYVAAPATDPNFLADGLLRIYLSGTEIAASAIPANVLNDTIFFYGIFQKF